VPSKALHLNLEDSQGGMSGMLLLLGWFAPRVASLLVAVFQATPLPCLG